MTARRIATLDPNRCDGSLLLANGNLVVTTNVICDFHRSVFADIAFATGTIGFEAHFYSTSNPAAGLADLCSVGVAEHGCPTNQYCGENVLSYGLRPSDGAGNAGFYTNNTLQGSLFGSLPERAPIGVMLVNDPTTPIVTFHYKGNYLGQMNLTAGKFYLPAVSIGSSVAAGDVSAYLNFGQHALDFPFMSVNK